MRKRSVSFFFLLFFLTIFFALGLNLWMSTERLLKQCDETYTTIGVLEYMGAQYPDETVRDEKMLAAVDAYDFSALSSHENVLSWDPSSRFLGHIDGFTQRIGKTMAYDGAVVLVVKPFEMKRPAVDVGPRYSWDLQSSFDPESYYACFVSEIIYKGAADISVGDIVAVFGNIPDYVKNDSYVIVGSKFDSGVSYASILLYDFQSQAAAAAGYTQTVPASLNVTGNIEQITADENNIYRKIADYFNVMNNSFSVYASNDVDALEDFNQMYFHLEDGRFFTQEEYDNGVPVCIISSEISRIAKLKLGDSVPISFIAQSDLPPGDCYWPDTGFGSTSEFEVVGITNDVSGKDHRVYVPKNAITGSVTQENLGYVIGQFTIKNGCGIEFAEYAEPLLGERMRLTVYDQGYTAVVRSLNSVKQIAVVITLISALAGVAVLLIYAYLFVYKQKDTVVAMLCLGTEKRDVTKYIAVSSGFISALAMLTGGVITFFLARLLNSFVASVFESLNSVSISYSSSSLGVSQTFIYPESVSVLTLLIIILCLFAFSMALNLFFLYLVFRQQRPDQNRERLESKTARAPKGPLKSSGMRGGALKYALLSIRRGGPRALVVPAVSLIITLFISFLTSTALSYRQQLDTVYDGVSVSGYFTDYRGRQMERLLVGASAVEDLLESGYVSDLSMSYHHYYRFLGIPVTRDGATHYVAPMEIPTGTYGMETLLDSVETYPHLVFTNNLSTSAEFYYCDDYEIDFMEGYDESFLSAEYTDDTVPPAIVPESFMKKYGVEYGDVVRLNLDTSFSEFDVRVIGSFTRQGNLDNIYCQISAHQLLSVSTTSHAFTSYGIPVEITVDGNFDYSSVLFNVPEAKNLDALKSVLLEHGYSEVGQIRMLRQYILIDDKELNDTVSTLTRQIYYMYAVYPLMYILIAAVSFLVSFLLIFSRQSELAVMKSLGATKLRGFFSFFDEQALLCLAGTAAAMLIWFISGKAFTGLQFISVGLFVLVYFLGCARAIRSLGKAKLLDILSDKE